jgi:hypothetical protein
MGYPGDIFDCFKDTACVGALRPDLFLAQEINSDLAGRILNQLNIQVADEGVSPSWGQYTTPMNVNSTATGAPVTIFFRKKRFLVLSATTVGELWPGGNAATVGEACVRTTATSTGIMDGQWMAVLRMSDKIAGKAMVVANAHLPFPRSGSVNNCLRTDGDGMCARPNMVNLLNAINGQAGQLRILGGDFNSHPRCPEGQVYTNASGTIWAPPLNVPLWISNGFYKHFMSHTGLQGHDATAAQMGNGVGMFDHIYAWSDTKEWPFHAPNESTGALPSGSRDIPSDFYGTAWSDHHFALGAVVYY